MAQPMTLVATPDPEPTDTTCPAWCAGDRIDHLGDGDTYHGSAFALFTATHFDRGSVEITVSVSRIDLDDKIGETEIHVIGTDDVVFTPTQARRAAALLLNAADDVDPLPVGELLISAAHVRLGDEVLTGDGWQTVVGHMVFAEQVGIWTDTFDHNPETDGWQYEPADPVRVRRRIHGSAAIAFVEPIR